ncbi:FliA/WhiG family RNA polymerase sigma factor [Tyzzerella sp. OttesenSCG-928-J15]|nr:FliA/WhiG family RNA polymerase sigma factor [Tyzzerella sp. OttesenSCG-928-J15]
MILVDKNEKLWKAYEKSRDSEIKEKLIIEYAPLVKYVAGRLSVHLGHRIEYEDLISYGIFGLIDAIDKFDYGKGVKFETYASLRIRGAIIDNIRKLDWVPRTLRQKNKQLELAYSELEAELGREPTEEEVAEKLDMPIETARDLIKKSSILTLVSFDDYLTQNHEEAFVGINNAVVETPESNYDKKELQEMLAEAIDKLSEREKKVIVLYYFEDLTLKEISRIMGVSESRISQIHSKAVLRLQARLGKYKSILYM